MHLMTVEAAAEYMQVTPRQFRRYFDDPAFPAPFQPGKKYFFDREEIDRWIAKHRIEKKMLDDLAGQYDDGSKQDESSIIEFITDSDLHQIDEVLSGQIGIHDADTDWLESLLAKVKDLGSVQSDTHVFGVTRAYKVAAQ